jgi:hypothetical protein
MIELVQHDNKVSKDFWIGERGGQYGDRVLVAWNVAEMIAAAEWPNWPQITLIGWGG